MTLTSLSPTQKGVLSGLVVLLAGFGVMLAFWLTSSYTGERGLPFYLSATIGDALILPALAFLGTRIAAENGVTRREVRLASLTAALGVLVGATTQAYWLRSDDINLN